MSKLVSGARLPGSELTGTQRKPERMLEARSCGERLADIRVNSDDVRFGSKADIGVCVADVRFTPESGHSAGHKNYPLSAISIKVE